jgi:hypothetical protein
LTASLLPIPSGRGALARTFECAGIYSGSGERRRQRSLCARNRSRALPERDEELRPAIEAIAASCAASASDLASAAAARLASAFALSASAAKLAFALSASAAKLAFALSASANARRGFGTIHNPSTEGRGNLRTSWKI